MGFVSQLVRCGAVSSPREDGEGDGSCSKFDRPHQQLPCQILPREASAAKPAAFKCGRNHDQVLGVGTGRRMAQPEASRRPLRLRAMPPGRLRRKRQNPLPYRPSQRSSWPLRTCVPTAGRGCWRNGRSKSEHDTLTRDNRPARGWRLGGAGRHRRQPDQHRTSPRRQRQPLSASAVPALLSWSSAPSPLRLIFSLFSPPPKS